MNAEPSKPVYVLQGKDVLTRDRAYLKIVDSLLGDADRQLCLTQYDPSVEIATVLDELRTLPFLAPHRVVVVREAEAFISSNKDLLDHYLDKPANSGSLILIVNSLDGRLSVSKKLKAVGTIIDCKEPDKADLAKWITAEVKRLDKTIDQPAAHMLAEWIGTDLASLRNELEKLSIYVGDKNRISVDDISAIVAAGSSPEAFALSNAITAGDIKTALEVTAGALATRGAEFMMLGQVAWHIRRALQVQQEIEAGASANQAMKSARVFYGQREFEAMLKRRSRKKLQSDMRRLIAADLAMKSGVPPKAAMQQLVVELCS